MSSRRRGLAVAVGAVVALRVGVALGATNPHLFPDEIGYLGAARLLAGQGPPFVLGRSPRYYPLYSAVIAPVFRLGLSPAGSFRAVLLVNALLGGATTAAVYASCRRFLGATTGAAAAAAMVAGVYPGQALLTMSAWAENLLPLCLLAWLWTVASFLQRRSLSTAVCCAVAALACFWAHPRGLVVVAMTAPVFVMAAGSPGWSWRRAAVAVLGLAGAVAVSRAAINGLLAPLYDDAVARPGERSSIDRLLDFQSWGSIARSLLGQVWYQVTATAGLVALGAHHVVRRWRARFVGSDGDPLVAETSLLLLCGTAVVLLVVSSVSVTGGDRADSLFYGRYVDATTPLLVAAGVVSIWEASTTERRVRQALAGLGIVAVTGLLVGAVPGVADPRPLVGDMVLGVLAQIDLVGRTDVIRVAGLTLGLIAVAALAGWRARAGTVAVLTVGFAAASLHVSRAPQPTFFHAAATLEDFATQTAAYTQGQPVGIDLDFVAEQDHGMFGYQWFEPGLRLYDVSTSPAHAAWLIGPLRWTEALDAGAELVSVDPSRAVGLWVLPGASQDRLRHDGALLPGDFPSLLPAAALRAELDSPRRMDSAYGADIDEEVTVVHQGGRFRWPRFDPTGAGFATGRVRVGVRVWAARDRHGAPVRTAFADLPHDLLPGERARVDVPLGHDLPRGDYVIGIDLLQVNGQWFNDEPPRVTELHVR